MPMLRGYFIEGPWRYQHLFAASEVRRGARPITANDDDSAFRSPYQPPSDDFESMPVGWYFLHGDLLAYAWRPMYALIGATGLMVLIWGVIGFFYSIGELRPVWGWSVWGWQAAVMVPLGCWMLIWYPFLSPIRRFVLFDRRRGLVHIPRWFSRRMDAVRFADATVLIIDVPAGYMGMEPKTQAYVGCPGWSLRRGEYPPRYARRDLLAFARDRGDDKVEQGWRRVVEFMQEEADASPWLGEHREILADAVQFRHDGDWSAFWRARAKQDKSEAVFGLELLTEPNWVLDDDERWRYVGEGARERIVVPDGPDDQREPLARKEPLLRRLRRAVLGAGDG